MRYLTFGLFMLFSCVTSDLTPRDVVLKKSSGIPSFDAALLELLPERLVDCGVHGFPGRILEQYEVGSQVRVEWGGVTCARSAMKRRSPYVLRYSGIGMDSRLEVAYFSIDGEHLRQLSLDTLGPFELVECGDFEFHERAGLRCLRKTLVRDMRGPRASN